MKTKLGLLRQFRFLYSSFNLLRFRILTRILGFDVANKFLQQLDKQSLIRIIKSNGAKIGQNTDIETGITFQNCENYSNLIIGNNCHIGKDCFFDLREKVVIGNNVIISMQCTFITHIDLNNNSLSRLYKAASEAIYLEENCYIGARSMILKGVKINKYSFIAAGSLVIRSVEEKCMVGGVPAKKLKTLEILDNLNE
jgi:acetyltransferase-like isoleucine patch superfamily enzyme